MLVALSVVMALGALCLPVVGVILALLYALPILVLVVRHGMRWAVMAAAASAVLMAALIEPMVSLRMAISFTPTGLALGIGFRRRWGGVRVFVLALAVSILAKLAALGLLFAVTGLNPLNMELEAVQQTFDASFKMNEVKCMSREAIKKSRAQRSE